jgi:hypothetical protein
MGRSRLTPQTIRALVNLGGRGSDRAFLRQQLAVVRLGRSLALPRPYAAQFLFRFKTSRGR